MDLNKQLRETEGMKARSIGKIISHLKREFDFWAIEELEQHGFTDFKMAHMPFIMNISPDGISTTELAATAKVTKQAMSKVAKELQKLGYIETKLHAKDKRSTMIFLTTKGKKLVVGARLRMTELMKNYQKLLGAKNFELLTDQLLQLIEYHSTLRSM